MKKSPFPNYLLILLFLLVLISSLIKFTNSPKTVLVATFLATVLLIFAILIIKRTRISTGNMTQQTDSNALLSFSDSEIIKLEAAHHHCTSNEAELMASSICGCFYCMTTFASSEIDEWLTENGGGKTAFCPKCGIDSVIGSESGFSINSSFLSLMHSYWFERTVDFHGT